MNISNIPNSVREWLEEGGYGQVTSYSPVGGGCINNGARLETFSKKSFFLKTNSHTPPDMFAREEEGLLALQVENGPRVPHSFLTGRDFILLEDLKPGPRNERYWLDFGHQLAVLHQQTSPEFGFTHDNYIGSTPQPNHWTNNGYQFFQENRLLFQAELAASKRLLDHQTVRRIEKLCSLLPDLIPNQPASLIHGDLWSGNLITTSSGEPAIIDPAVYFGWAEAELAMTGLFGGFPPIFYIAYQEIRPLDAGFQGRFPLYNLYHLLNHLNLFGFGYHGQVISILDRYVEK